MRFKKISILFLGLLISAAAQKAAVAGRAPARSAAAALDPDVARVYAYPVPFRPTRGDEKITFAFLPASGDIRIFTLSGELLKKIDFSSPVDGKMEWDVTNASGEKLGSDVFVYVVQSGSSRKTGKIVVVR